MPITLYQDFVAEFNKSRMSDAATARLAALGEASLTYLSGRDQRDLISRVQGKSYFSFEENGKLTRPVNADLFQNTSDGIGRFVDALREVRVTDLPPEEITRACYTIAMGFSCVVDLKKQGDQKTPGTFFEYFVCHLFARQLGIEPKTRIDVLNLDRPASLPTDWIFDLGVDQPKFHLPVKTSTRERVIQVWAHQRVLDGVYGHGRFLGTLACLAETKLGHRKLEVVEICLPGQWRIYQLFIAQMHRVYYLDVPNAYERLNHVFPRIRVRPFGEFFHEAQDLCAMA